VILAALALASMPPKALIFLTGSELYDHCQRASSLVCVSYVMGIADTIASQANLGAIPRQFCMDENVTGRQVTDVVVRYLTDHPDSRHNSAASIVVPALREAFPCR
jgi:hypothetical protein